MPDFNSNLHGNAPDKSPVALLLIDVINDLEFDEGERLLQFALPMAERIAALKRRAAEYLSDPSTGRPASEVMEKLRREFP